MRGGQKSLLNLISNLNRAEFEPHVIVPTEIGGLSERLKNQGADVSIVELPKILDWHLIEKVKTLWNLFNIIKRHKIEIVHTDGPRNTLYAGIIAKIVNIPLIWHVRASNRDRYDPILTKLSTRIILVADALKSRFLTAGNGKKFVTIYNGVDPSKFCFQENGRYVRQKYNLNSSGLLICVTARVERLKGQKYLIEACGKLKKRIEDFYILLAGEVTDTSYLRECQEKAGEFGIRTRLIIAGQIENICQILNASDIFVLPSLLEAFPRSVIEAMAAAKPVIVTKVGGCVEAVEDNISGFIVSARDSEGLADKILLLANDKDLRDRLGAEARQRAEKMFNSHDNVKKTENLYYEVLKKY